MNTSCIWKQTLYFLARHTIAQVAAERPDEADFRLKSLAKKLKETDSGRGEAILRGEQHVKFFGAFDKEEA